MPGGMPTWLPTYDLFRPSLKLRLRVWLWLHAPRPIWRLASHVLRLI